MRVVRVIAITIVWLVAARPLEAATLAWDPSAGPNVSGYRVSYSTQPGVHSTQVDVGNVLTFSLNPPAGQSYYVVVQAYGDSGFSPESNEVVVSAAAPANLPPTLNQPPNQSGIVGSPATLALTASDPESATVTLTATGLPAGLSLNSATRTISGTLQTAGTYNVTVTASDGTLSASRSFTWIVSAPTPANQPPTLNQPPNQSGVVGSSATLALTASDPENATLAFTATGLPAGLSLNSATRTISGTLQTAGTYNVTVTVSDGSLSASRSLTWTVSAQPASTADTTAPTVSFTEPSNNATLNGKNVKIRVTATDAGGVRSVRYSLNGNALSGEITDAPYQYMWDISKVAGGTYQLTARAVDNAGNAGTATIDVTVSGGGNPGNGKKSLTGEELAMTDEAAVRDVPVNGDFDGDGVDDPGAFTASTGEWRLWLSSVRYAPTAPLIWGGENDVPVPADYDGDGRADLAVYRPSSGTWSIVMSNKGNPSRFDIAWGRDEDAPMAFDYDQDGKADLALRRPGGFDILLSSKGYAASVAVR
jgi:hypothetical protein